MTERHICYIVVYEEQEGWRGSDVEGYDHERDGELEWFEMETYVTGDPSLDECVEVARRKVAEGMRNVRVIELVEVEREVCRL